jgi:hypothetical protein
MAFSLYYYTEICLFASIAATNYLVIPSVYQKGSSGNLVVREKKEHRSWLALLLAQPSNPQKYLFYKITFYLRAKL